MDRYAIGKLEKTRPIARNRDKFSGVRTSIYNTEYFLRMPEDFGIQQLEYCVFDEVNGKNERMLLEFFTSNPELVKTLGVHRVKDIIQNEGNIILDPHIAAQDDLVEAISDYTYSRMPKKTYRNPDTGKGIMEVGMHIISGRPTNIYLADRWLIRGELDLEDTDFLDNNLDSLIEKANQNRGYLGRVEPQRGKTVCYRDNVLNNKFCYMMER